jgi:hypothetical protein
MADEEWATRTDAAWAATLAAGMATVTVYDTLQARQGITDPQFGALIGILCLLMTSDNDDCFDDGGDE